MDRCDLATHRECSCIASGVPCRAQPGAFEIIRDANTDMATRGSWLIAGLFLAGAFVLIGVSAKVGFERQAKAYELAGRV